jgi:hypothetical protein
MTTLQRLSRWKETGAITAVQYDAISAIVRKDRFSVFFELNALLYLGVLSFVGGVAWVIREYVATRGDAAILSGLSLILVASFYYCFSRTLPFSPGQVESPNLAFDYVLYLGCLTFGTEIGYIESRFQLMQSEWDYYLLISAALFFVLAYRFDNRFVLSLALSTLAAWFGVKVSRFGLVSGDSFRTAGIAYSLIAGAAGVWLYRSGIKKHFLETYLHVAANVLYLSLLSGVLDRSGSLLYSLGLIALVVTSIGAGLHFRRFAFVLYGTIYGYIGMSSVVLRDMRDVMLGLAYLAASSAIVIVCIVFLARRFGREE